MQEYVDRNGLDDLDEIFAVAFELATKYGEGAASAACDMYDAIAEAQGMSLPPAEPARTPTMEEVRDVVGYHIRKTPNDVPAAAGKLVKKTATRTMRKNAARDNARMALVPSGDGCVFCKMLASRGWESARHSKSFEAHLHAHCRCEYVVRFGNDLNVEGYDPEAIRKEFDDTGERTWKEKINALRRQTNKKNKTEIEELNENNKSTLRKGVAMSTNTGIRVHYNEKASYRIEHEDFSEELKIKIADLNRELAKLGDASGYEYASIVDVDTGEYRGPYTDEEANSVRPDYKFIAKHKNCIFLHNHNTDTELSFPDVSLVVNDTEINYVAAIRDDGIITVVKSSGKKTSEPLWLWLDDNGKNTAISNRIGRYSNNNAKQFEIEQRDEIIKHFCEGGMTTYGLGGSFENV